MDCAWIFWGFKLSSLFPHKNSISLNGREGLEAFFHQAYLGTEKKLSKKGKSFGEILGGSTFEFSPPALKKQKKAQEKKKNTFNLIFFCLLVLVFVQPQVWNKLKKTSYKGGKFSPFDWLGI